MPVNATPLAALYRSGRRLRRRSDGRSQNFHDDRLEMHQSWVLPAPHNEVLPVRTDHAEELMRYSTLPLAVPSMPKQPTQRPLGRSFRSWRTLLAVGLPALLASCGGYDHGDNCFQCGPGVQQSELSLGVVSADFNKDGFADVVALSTIEPPSAPNASNPVSYTHLDVYKRQY